MEIFNSTYKAMYKAYVKEHMLNDDSHMLTLKQMQDFFIDYLCWDTSVMIEFCKEHDIYLHQDDSKDHELISFEIYFDDLNEDAQTRFRDAGLWHENIEMTPLAIFECEPEEDDEDYLSSLMYGVDNNQ